MTINQIDELFNNIALAHYQINDYHYGSVWTIEEKMNKEAKYPMLIVVPLQSQTQEQVKDRTFEVMVMDIPNKDKANLKEVWSDTEQILDDVIRIFRRESITYEIVGDPVLLPYDEIHSDWVSGYRAELVIRTDFNSNNCDIPASSFSSPNTSSLVTILDQDGNTVTTLNPGSTYSVIVASGIDSGSSTTTYTIQVVDI